MLSTYEKFGSGVLVKKGGQHQVKRMARSDAVQIVGLFVVDHHVTASQFQTEQLRYGTGGQASTADPVLTGQSDRARDAIPSAGPQAAAVEK